MTIDPWFGVDRDYGVKGTALHEYRWKAMKCPGKEVLVTDYPSSLRLG